MLVNEHEARLLGGVLAAIGLGTVAASVAKLAGWPSDSAAYLFAAACGSPLVLAFAVVMGVWVSGELSTNRVRELEAKAKLAQASAPVIVVEDDPSPLVDPKLQAKRVAVETFFRAGDKAGGFSEGKLAGCVGSDHGPWLRHFYMSAAGGEWLRQEPGNIGTVWNYERTLDAAILALRSGSMPLPPGPVPDVSPLPDSAAQRKAPQKSKAQAKRTVDGLRAD